MLHSLNMELDLQSLFGLHVTVMCTAVRSHWLRPRNLSPHLGSYMYVGQYDYATTNTRHSYENKGSGTNLINYVSRCASHELR
jgi:hypothetical protein